MLARCTGQHGPTSPRTRADYDARFDADGLAGVGSRTGSIGWKFWRCPALEPRPVNGVRDVDGREATE